jgi:hypothetical protein
MVLLIGGLLGSQSDGVAHRRAPWLGGGGSGRLLLEGRMWLKKTF